MTMTLTNKTGRMKVYNLPHKTYCAALGKCACTLLPGRNGARVCASLTLPADAEVEDVQDAVMQVSEIAKDIISGALRVKREPRQAPGQPPVTQVDTKRLRKKRRTKTSKQTSTTGGES